MTDILFLEPIFKRKIWGGERIKKEFNFEVDHFNIGECWLVAAHVNGDLEIKNGRFKGLKLSKVFLEHPELFSSRKLHSFPFIIKLIDAKTDLSIQVHPNNSSNQSKTECWYVLNEVPKTIKLGSHKSKEELYQATVNKTIEHEIDDYLVSQGDLVYIPSGVIHALKEGLLVLEIQEASDVTYRLYDYDRLDLNGQKRKLHIQEALDSLSSEKGQVISKNEIKDYYQFNCQAFELEILKINDFFIYNFSAFKVVIIISGAGNINGYSVQKGDGLILTSLINEAKINGSLELLIVGMRE